MPRAKKPPVVPVGTGLGAKLPDVAPGGKYGSRAETEAAIAASPLARGGGTVTPITPNTPPPQADPQAVLDQATAYSPDGPALTDPSQNPNEPVTAGLASGPGAGPGVLNLPDPRQADIRTWQTYLPTLEYLASQPTSTASTRNFVRRLRAVMPPSVTQ